MKMTMFTRWYALILLIGFVVVAPSPAFAAVAGVPQIESFIRSIIAMLAGLSGLIATGFFVFGGLAYMTSSGNPEHLDRAKRTLLFAAVGLAITLGAFVLSNIVTTLATSAFGS